MKIDMNKDFETAFRNMAWKGLTVREVVTALIALGSAAGVVIAIWQATRVPINVCVYFGIPVMIPIVGVGLVRYQGSSAWEIGKEIWYLHKTRELPFEAEEYSGTGASVFTMKVPKTGKTGKRKTGGRYNGSF